MAYVDVPYTTRLAETLAALVDPGLLLVTKGHDGYLNAMTIGWGTVGPIWGKPIFVVLVRPSRFTHGLLSEGSSYTVCVPSPAMREAANFCGTKSGRSHKKFEELGFEPLASTQIDVPGIVGCPLIYECRPVHVNDVIPGNLTPEIQERAYPRGDFHRVYFGQILAVRALESEPVPGEGSA
jgi:flavin reductase (DIM6/NTAB) family NADH-FMN oxidoreductase RutF